jgi:hypothetical protein
MFVPVLSTTIDVTPGRPSKVELLVTGKLVIVLRLVAVVPVSVLLTVTTSPIRTVVLVWVQLGPAIVPAGQTALLDPLFVQNEETTPFTVNTNVELLNVKESDAALL